MRDAALAHVQLPFLILLEQAPQIVKRRNFIVLFVALLVTVVVITLIFFNDPSSRTFTLSNGDTLIFRGLSVGTNHNHCFGNLLQRMAARLPGSVTNCRTSRLVPIMRPMSSGEAKKA